MQENVKKQIDVLVPLAGASAAGYYAYKNGKKDNWQFLAFVFIAVFVVLYITTTKVTRIIVDNSNKPAPGNVPNDTGGSTSGNFNATMWAQQLRDDLYGWWFNDTSLYRTVSNMSNTELAMVSNAWLKNHFSEKSQTLIRALESEWTYGEHGALVDTIVSRLKSMGHT